MDLNFLLLLIVCISCVSFVLRTLLLKHNRGWAYIAGSILSITIALLYVAPQWAGLIGGSLWALFLVLPLVGFAHVNVLIIQERYRDARRLVTYLRWLHPVDGWFEQPSILQALEMGQRGQMAEALRSLHPHGTVQNPMGRNATAILLLMEARWHELLRWLQTHVPESVLTKDPHLVMYYLRALGETGDLNGLVWGFERYSVALKKGGNTMPLHLAQLFVLAFCGQVDGVHYLLNHALSGYSHQVKRFWRLTAQLATQGTLPRLCQQMRALRSRDGDMALKQAVTWRLSNPPVRPEDTLTPGAWEIVQRIQQEVRQGRSLEQPLALRPPRNAQMTYTLLVVNFFVFGLEVYWGGSQNPWTLDRLGALIPAAVVAGEWWRLVSANFLHYGLGHLVTNALGLYLLGPFVEATLGRWRYLGVYLGVGVGTMGIFTALALYVNDEPFQRLVGASAAIMGLLGVIVVILLQRWYQERSAIATERLRLFVSIVILQFIFDWLVPEISIVAHSVGLLLGIIAGMILIFGLQHRGHLSRPSQR